MLNELFISFTLALENAFEKIKIQRIGMQWQNT
ncbi:hypothetical protein SAMN05444395_109115 [Flavobacterium fryxellicola]|nr:hypothetical protein SAMN05444395_109115 [Flavobacterium fryxellicola]